MLAVAAVVLAAGCSKDPLADVPGGGSEGTGRTITATFDLARDFEVGVEVKADGSEDMTKIRNVWVIQMAPDGSRMLQAPLYVSSLTAVDGDYRAKFEVQEEPCKMIFVANTHDAAAYSGLELTSKEADVAAVARDIADETYLTYDGVPMCGMWSGTPVIAVPGKVSMTRAVARVTFNLGADLPAGHSFEVQSVQVRQVPSMLCYYRDEAGLDKYPYPGLTNDQIIDYEMQTPDNLRFAGGYSPINQMFMWYLPENARGMGTASGQFRKTAENAPAGQADYCTYVEVYGKYRTGVTDETCNTTYRLYLGGNNIKDYNLLRNRAYTVNVTLRGQNEADMRVGNMLESANCFMVSQPSTEYMFDATVMGNGSVTPATSFNGNWPAPAIGPTPLEPDGAMLVWETGAAGDVIAPGSVKLSDDGRYISFRTSATIGGNAVIAATQGGEIIWSWHIWSTTYDPERDYDTYVTRTITWSNYNSLPSRKIGVMKVNLGALSTTPGDVSTIGLYYQWGRKDPFIGPADFSNEKSTPFQNKAATSNAAGYEWKAVMSPKGIPASIQNPTRLIYYASDWVLPSLANLWGNPTEGNNRFLNLKDGSKSIYDPCPKGWRVARSDTWTMFTTSAYPDASKLADMNIDGDWDSGWHFYFSDVGSGNTAFYSTSGFRESNTGRLRNPGLRGYCWSSTTNMSSVGRAYALNLDSYNLSVSPIEPLDRAVAMPVRCTKEE